MDTTSYSELRKHLAAALDSVAENHQPILITRGGGKPSAVLMSLEDFASFEESRYLLANPANAKRLLKATKELDEGGGEEKSLPL